MIYQAEIVHEFFDLIEQLREMSRRWQSIGAKHSPQSHGTPPRPIDLDVAGQYASRLEEFHAMCAGDTNSVAYILFCSGANGLLRSTPSTMPYRTESGSRQFSNGSTASASSHPTQVGNPQYPIAPSYFAPHQSLRAVGVTGGISSIGGSIVCRSHSNTSRSASHGPSLGPTFGQYVSDQFSFGNARNALGHVLYKPGPHHHFDGSGLQLR